MRHLFSQPFRALSPIQGRYLGRATASFMTSMGFLLRPLHMPRTTLVLQRTNRFIPRMANPGRHPASVSCKHQGLRLSDNHHKDRRRLWSLDFRHFLRADGARNPPPLQQGQPWNADGSRILRENGNGSPQASARREHIRRLDSQCARMGPEGFPLVSGGHATNTELASSTWVETLTLWQGSLTW